MDAISRQAAIQAIEKRKTTNDSFPAFVINSVLDSAIRSVESVPLVTTPSPLHAGWIKRRTGWIDEVVCSNCLHTGYPHFAYCPHCGASMKPERKG